MLFTLLFSCKSSDITPDLQILKKIEENPEQAQIYCDQLTDPMAKERCTTISMRPHLWENPQSLEIQKSKRTSGPAAKHLLPQLALKSTSYQTPSSQECSQAHCWEKKAIEATTISDANTYCQYIENEKWRTECFFVSAEKHLQKLGYTASATLCLSSGDFAANCFMHLSYALAEQTPPAISDLSYEWERTNGYAEQIQDFWKDKDVRFGDAMEAQFWAKALDVSYTKAGIVAGNPIDHLPPQALPHIHAAASMHLMLMEGAQSYTLEEWAKRTHRALQARLPQKSIRPQRGYAFRKAQNPWPADAANEIHIPATFYMTDGRRTYTNDVHTDLLITTIEAAARCKNGHFLVREGTIHSHKLVLWTAQRLSNR